MFRIGIIGSDSSHAEAFSSLINIPSEEGGFLFPDCRVTVIYGLDPVKTKQVAEKCKINLVADNLEELYDRVDAVMVVLRDGSLHKEYALPFIERGMAVWIDKPFTFKEEEALELIKAARESGSLLTGGSTCRYSPDITAAKEEIVSGNSIGSLRSAQLSFVGDFDNPYGGAVFYGSHLIEIALELFGNEVIKVSSLRSQRSLTTILTYEDFEVTLSLTEGIAKTPMLLLGDKGCYYREMDISKVYSFGLQAFIKMLRTEKLPIELEDLLIPVRLFNKVEEAAALTKAIAL